MKSEKRNELTKKNQNPGKKKIRIRDSKLSITCDPISVSREVFFKILKEFWVGEPVLYPREDVNQGPGGPGYEGNGEARWMGGTFLAQH